MGEKYIRQLLKEARTGHRTSVELGKTHSIDFFAGQIVVLRKLLKPRPSEEVQKP
jgi:hypothetical protein